MSERDEDHAMNMPRISPREVEPCVANTADEEEVTDFKLWLIFMTHTTKKSRYQMAFLVKILFYRSLDSLLS